VQNAHVPYTVTDCLGLIDTLKKGREWAVSYARPMARIWQLLFDALDGYNIPELLAEGRFVWMPAHGRAASIGTAVKSNGELVSPIDWRANRLADAIAKDAALSMAAPPRVRQLMKEALAAVEHSCAFIGAATYVANNCMRQMSNADGVVRQVKCRDSTAQRPRTKELGHTRAKDAADAGKASAEMSHRRPCGGSGYPHALAADAAADAAFHSLWMSRLSLSLRPAAGPTASEIMVSLRARVRARARL
jgi:hypothetical protein